MPTGQGAAVSLIPCGSSNGKQKNTGPRMITDKWYWAPRAEELHNPLTAKGPFDSEMEATEAAYQEIASSPQLALPGLGFKHHFFIGRAVSPSIAIPDPGFEAYLDDVRTENIPLDMDNEDEWDNWLFDVSPDTVEQLNQAFKAEFQQWIMDNSLYPPVCGVEDMSYHEV